MKGCSLSNSHALLAIVLMVSTVSAAADCKTLAERYAKSDLMSEGELTDLRTCIDGSLRSKIAAPAGTLTETAKKKPALVPPVVIPPAMRVPRITP